MADQILDGYPDVIQSLTLRPARGGIFEVTLNGELIFSKKQQGRFPEENEVLPKVEALRRRRT